MENEVWKFAFHGRNRSGLLRVSVGKRRCLVDGTSIPEKISDGACVFRMPVKNAADAGPHVASAVAPSVDKHNLIGEDLFVVAQGVRTGRHFLIRGRVVRWLPTRESSAKPGTRQSMNPAKYAQQLQRVKAAQDQGIDAMVSLPFIAAHSSRAAATVYRHIKAGALPAPSKVGRASVWPFSAVDAYARGTAPTQQAPISTIDAAIALPQNIVKESK